MTQSASIGRLTPNEWERLQTLAERFEQSWQSEKREPANLLAYLPPEGDPLRSAALHELIKTELEICWRAGRRIELGVYLEKIPELGSVRNLPAALVYEEYRVRQLFGDKPPLAVYERRFPDQFAAIQEMLKDQPLPAQDIGTIAPPSLPTDSLTSSSRQIGDPSVSTDKAAAEGTGDPSFSTDVYLAQTQDRPLPKTQTLPGGGSYELVKRIGSGTFGEVWRAIAPGGVEVAIKIISRPVDHEEAKRELESLELTKQFRHPFLLQVQAFWKYQDRLYIAMELADGSLRDRLKECKAKGQQSLPVPDLLRYFREAADALDYLHSERVLHRDVKPDNILLLKGHTKVADFGLARLQQEKWLFSASGSGTPAYMAPEVWAGKVCEHSDQYSLAVTFAELRLGKWPFANVMEAMNGTAPNLTTLSGEEQRVIMKALARDPRQRYRNCRDFVQALEEVLTPPEQRKEKQIGRRRFLYISAAALLSGSGLGGYLIYRNIHSSPKSDVGEPKIDIPEACQPAKDASVVTFRNRQLYDRIDRILPSGTRIPFVLIPQENEGDPPTFYIMQTKVWNDLFREFAGENPDAVNGSEWQKGGLADGKDLGVANGQLPVMRITVEEAHRFAVWLGGLLPTAQQWDRAAGCYEGQHGPFTGTWDESQQDPPQVAVNRALLGPYPVGRATKDESLWHVKDMAGNGQEWTRNTEDDRLIPVTAKKDKIRVQTRGRRYGDPRGPVRFTNRDAYLDEFVGSQDYILSDATVGFRVVIEHLGHGKHR